MSATATDATSKIISTTTGRDADVTGAAQRRSFPHTIMTAANPIATNDNALDVRLDVPAQMQRQDNDFRNSCRMKRADAYARQCTHTNHFTDRV